jgi:hypothetical protein
MPRVVDILSEETIVSLSTHACKCWKIGSRVGQTVEETPRGGHDQQRSRIATRPVMHMTTWQRPWPGKCLVLCRLVAVLPKCAQSE